MVLLHINIAGQLNDLSSAFQKLEDQYSPSTASIEIPTKHAIPWVEKRVSITIKVSHQTRNTYSPEWKANSSSRPKSSIKSLVHPRCYHSMYMGPNHHYQNISHTCVLSMFHLLALRCLNISEGSARSKETSRPICFSTNYSAYERMYGNTQLLGSTLKKLTKLSDHASKPTILSNSKHTFKPLPSRTQPPTHTYLQRPSHDHPWNAFKGKTFYKTIQISL